MGRGYVTCRGCGEREVGCHSSCPKYAKFREVVEKKKEQDSEGTLIGRYKKEAKKKYWRQK